jgi:hypothetical protein
MLKQVLGLKTFKVQSDLLVVTSAFVCGVVATAGTVVDADLGMPGTNARFNEQTFYGKKNNQLKSDSE